MVTFLAAWNCRGTGMQLLHALDNVTNMPKQYGRLQARLSRTNFDGDFLVSLHTTTSTNVWKFKLVLAKDCQCSLFHFARIMAVPVAVPFPAAAFLWHALPLL